MDLTRSLTNWFQVVPPCGGHLRAASPGLCTHPEFQVVPPCGGHHAQHVGVWEVLQVSSRAPVWGASVCHSGANAARSEFQVVPPCGGHRGSAGVTTINGLVSSRAPVWGASLQATAIAVIPPFQVVPPCGGHQREPGGVGAHDFVSSRAPVWGASMVGRHGHRNRRVSSRAPVWGASCCCCKDFRAARFQVVPPCGGHPTRLN